MMEWFFWPTRVSYANDPVGTALVGIVALLFGVGLGARLPRGRLRTALWVLPPLALAAEAPSSWPSRWTDWPRWPWPSGWAMSWGAFSGGSPGRRPEERRERV